jgi:glyoxylase-like metal-dependent hydrolase (beta-lactamase superfamily II)
MTVRTRAASSIALCALLPLWCASLVAVETDSLLPTDTPAYPPGLLDELRAASRAVPGAPPEELRYVTVAESHRPRSAVLDGGNDAPYVQARTAFQLVYTDGTLMIDAGMDEQVHRTFGMGNPEPYWQERNDAVQAALKTASLVLITHEHGDHVAGVIRSPDREQIAAHTVLTRAQVRTLTLAPQMPEIRLTPEQAADYIVIDYALYYPTAPGVVLLKAPGHTPGHQMVFVRLADGAEYLLSGDVTWALDGVTERRQRPQGTSDRIGEDRDALAHQITWLEAVMDEGVVVVPSHDTTRLEDLERRGLITQGLK